MTELTTAQRVEFARKMAGLTQIELAERIGAGSRPGTISEIEAGRLGIGKRAAAIAMACNTTTDFLLGLTDDPAPTAGLAAEIAALPAEQRAVIELLVRWLRRSA